MIIVNISIKVEHKNNNCPLPISKYPQNVGNKNKIMNIVLISFIGDVE